jgi:diguanylate cyclase (GGDEF)-like protein
MLAILDSVIDALTPGFLDQDGHLRTRVRMFLISHFFGPLLGLPIPIFLFFVDPQPFPHVHVLAASVLAFWLFPLLIRALPTLYTTLAFLSILNLNFAVLWGAYHYGGASSPFLLWYMLIPLLAFFYLGGSRQAQICIFGQIIIGLGTFSAAFFLSGHSFPVRVPVEEMVLAGLLSVFCATTYAFFMASYYARVVDSRSELIREIKRHEATLEMLIVSKEEADQAKHLAEARNVDLEAAKERLEYSALHDALTGLPNRRYVDERLLQDAAWCARHGGSLALLHIDLDRFKQINDTLGHGAGDVMLTHAANLLKASLRDDDFLARIGGDEFIIVRRSEGDTQNLTRLAEHIIDLIRQPVPYENRLCRIGASIGIAVDSGEDVDPKRLLVNSDIALYRAKARGRNRVELFSTELQAQIVHTKRVADDILRGLEQGEFVAHYQPQFDAKTFRLVGVEALVRWNHPTEGVLSPAAFLGIADELNAVAQIDRVVLDQALSDFDCWTAAGLVVPKISVNVSSKRLNDKELISSLRQLNIRPGTLSFELVEAIFLDETDDVVEWNIAQIKALGIDIEIDDFGTGHASIVGLLKLNPMRLKIDRQFITPVLSSPEHSKLVGSIVEIGKSLGIEVTAEGVETMEQASLLRELGCDILQGHAFAGPMTATDFKAFIDARSWRHASQVVPLLAVNKAEPSPAVRM